MKSWIITLVVSAATIIGFLSTPISCARQPEFKLPPIGQTFTIMPSYVGATDGNLKSPELDFKAVHLTVAWGGRSLDSQKGDPRLLLYKSGIEKPVIDVAWADLETAYRSTGCTDDLIATLDGPLVGQALICDGSIGPFDQYSHVEAVNSKGKRRMATSWSTYKISNDVLGVIIQLH